MKTVELTVYSFRELPEDIQEKVIEKWRSEGHEYVCIDEYIETLEKFCRIFGLRIKDYSLGSYNCNVKIEGYANIEEDIQEFDKMTDLRKWKYFMNNFYYPYFEYKKTYYLNHKKRVSRIIELNSVENYPLAGFCADYDILKPIGEYIKNPHRYDLFSDLFYNCVEGWISAVKKEIEYQDSDEYIIDFIENNDYEFLSDGEIYH